MSIAEFVQIVARGKGRGRPMTRTEAREAMTRILDGQAAPEAVGALLMVMRMRGETAAEIAGFTMALRNHMTGRLPAADLDWPSYAAGRSRGAPYFLLAARLVAQAGFTISMHGWNSHQTADASLRAALDLAGPGVRYTPLEQLSPSAFALLRLREVLGLRSCFNTVLRMWNPSGAPAMVQGVFHPSYRDLQSKAARLLGQDTLTIIKGGGGEFERHPAKDISLFGRRDGTYLHQIAPALRTEKRRLHDIATPADLHALWQGHVDDPFAIATITGTAALALWTLKAEPSLDAAHDMAGALWATRHKNERLSA